MGFILQLPKTLSGEKPSGEKPSGEKPSEEKPSGETPPEERLSGALTDSIDAIISGGYLQSGLIHGFGLGSPPPDLLETPPAHPKGPLLIFLNHTASAADRRVVEDSFRDAWIILSSAFTASASASASAVSTHSTRSNVPAFFTGTWGATVLAGTKQYVLGANHVLASNGRGKGAPVMSPGMGDQTDGGATVGDVAEFVEFQHPLGRYIPNVAPPRIWWNDVDCALAESKTIPTALSVAAGIPIGDAGQDNQIRKNGRTTGLTKSQVHSTNWYGVLDFSFGSFCFQNLGAAYSPVEPAFAAPGDSGALVIQDAIGSGPTAIPTTPTAVGLLMARAYRFDSNTGAFAGYTVVWCPMTAVRDQLAAKVGAPLSFIHQP